MFYTIVLCLYLVTYFATVLSVSTLVSVLPRGTEDDPDLAKLQFCFRGHFGFSVELFFPKLF
jgi:hypothetical protein